VGSRVLRSEQQRSPARPEPVAQGLSEASIRLSGLIILLASPAFAATDALWCVDGGMASPDPIGCKGSACTNPSDFESLQEAFDAAGAFASEADDPSAVDQSICVRSPSPLANSAVVDLDASGLRGQLTLLSGDLLQSTFCRPDGLAAEEPLIRISGGAPGDLTFRFGPMSFSSADCDRGPAPILSMETGDLEIGFLRIRGGFGPAFEIQSGLVQLGDARIQEVDGPVLVGSGDWLVSQSDFSHNRSSAPLIDHSAGDLDLGQLAIFGNVLNGSPVIRARGSARLDAVYVGGNVVLGATLLELGAGDAQRPARAGVWRSTIEGNQLLAAGTAEPAPAEEPGFEPFSRPICLPLGADGHPIRGRGTPSVKGGEPSSTPLLTVNSDRPQGAGSFVVAQSIIARNEQAAGGRLVHLEKGSPTQLSLLHNTIDLADGAEFLSSESVGHALLSARNWFITEVTQAPWTRLARVEATLDVVLDETRHPAESLEAEARLIGPFLYLPTPESYLRGSSAHLELSACERVGLICPELREDCAELIAGDRDVACALGAGAEFLPTEDLPAALTAFWPWTASWPGKVRLGSAAGSVGWRCDLAAAPFDRGFDSFGPTGDGDGYTELTDCGNEDPSIFPRVPEASDLLGGPCQSDPEHCFTCPSVASSGDDDDSATTASGTVSGDSPSNCIASGCAVSWAVLPCVGLLFPLTRRKR